MAENTKIQWATHTFNPWRGCSKIAPGCANCYADAQSKRNPKTLGIWGPNGTRVVASEAMWREPLKWNKAAGLLPSHIVKPHSLPIEHIAVERPRVFCASLADVFEEWPGQYKMPDGGWCVKHRKWGELTGFGSCALSGGNDAVRLDDVRARLFRTIDATTNLDWLLLTKRPENIRDRWLNGFGVQSPAFAMRKNVWLGTSIACQEDADRNVPELLKCRDLCAKTFLSIEPLIGPVNLRDLDNGRMRCHWNVLDGSYTQEMHDGGMGIVSRSPHHVDWVIVGGESGPNARPCDITWIRSIARQCRDAGVPCFVKQWGSNPHYTNHQGDSHSCGPIRDPKGGDPDEWPEDLRVREVPS